MSTSCPLTQGCDIELTHKTTCKMFRYLSRPEIERGLLEDGIWYHEHDNVYEVKVERHGQQDISLVAAVEDNGERCVVITQKKWAHNNLPN